MGVMPEISSEDVNSDGHWTERHVYVRAPTHGWIIEERRQSFGSEDPARQLQDRFAESS
jgi:hypothetical protein